MRCVAGALLVLLAGFSGVHPVLAGLPPSSATGIAGAPAPASVWLEHLSVTRTGGPRPMRKTGSFPVPFGGDVESLAETDDGIAVVVTGNIGGDGIWGMKLALLERDGSTIWSVDLPDDGIWNLAAHRDRIFAAMVSDFGRPVPGDGMMFDRTGRKMGRFNWKLLSEGDIHFLRYEDGFLAGSDGFGGARTGVRVARGPGHLVDIVMPGDWEVDGPFQHEREWDSGFAVMRVGLRRTETPAGRKVRGGRAARWKGQRLKIDGLPFWGPVKSGRNRVQDGEVWSAEEDGSAWVFLKTDAGPFEAEALEWLGYAYPLLVHYDRKWAVQSFLVIPRGDDQVWTVKWFVGHDAVYLYDSGSRLVERWEEAR